MKANKAIRMFNIYGEKYNGNNFAGNVWSMSGISPTISTCNGGRREPMIMLTYETN